MFCKHCGQQLADNATFCGNCGTPVVQQAPTAYGAGYGTPGQPPNIPNHLVGAILTTIFCCQIAGIVSIVYAAQVNGKLARGDVAGAMASSKNASTWMWVGVIVGGLINLVWIGATVIPAIMAAAAD
jgi:hypothetical protein